MRFHLGKNMLSHTLLKLSYDLFLYIELRSQYFWVHDVMFLGWICHIVILMAKSRKSPDGSQLLPCHNYHNITNDKKCELWHLTVLITCNQTLKSYGQKKQERVAWNTVHNQTAPLKWALKILLFAFKTSTELCSANPHPLYILQSRDYNQTLSNTWEDAAQQNSYFVLAQWDKRSHFICPDFLDDFHNWPDLVLRRQ